MRSCSVTSGGPSARHCAAGDGRRCAGDVVVLAVPGRRTVMMASAIGHAWANEDVWEVGGIVAKLRARGESEGSADATRRRRAPACPGHVHARPGASGRV
jgi:hypothetical protein